MRYYDVYVENLTELFTYCDKNDEFSLGDFVVVPFKKTKKIAIIVSENLQEKFDFKVLNINSHLKNSIKLSENQLDLIRWMVNYYVTSYDAVIKCLLPKKINLNFNRVYEINLNLPLKKFNKILEENNDNSYIRFLKKISISYSTAKTKFKKRIVDELIDKEFLKSENNFLFLNIEKFLNLKNENLEIFEYFLKRINIKKDKLEKLVKKTDLEQLLASELLELKLYQNLKSKEKNKKLIELVKKNLKLTQEQDEIVKKIENSEKKYFLLKGMTGSGKTEIYIKLIKNSLSKGEGSIFLVPEISLTPQMIKRLNEEFSDNIAIFHSKLSDSERENEWKSIYFGEKKIALGARSAVFLPVKNLKYIILDEEHELTYKQENNPRYDARYVAIKRSIIEGNKVILGSATPSIESYYYAKNNFYELLNLNKRYGISEIPNIEIVDMKNEENLFFSKKMLLLIKETLKNNEQVMLFLNRKGYSTFIQCKECGYVEECKNCSIKMTYYSGINKLKCNYCGKTIRYTGKCPKCGSLKLMHLGKGIERIEEELKKYFDVPIVKIDSNVTKKQDLIFNLYNDFLMKKYKIMIGTQAIVKGLHFPNVTFVGVINADMTLNFPDFRSGERTFQLLTQVAGRSGRGLKKGKVLIQTYQPENEIIAESREENYENFYNKEIENRKLFNYPPYVKLINIGISSENEEILETVSTKLYKNIVDTKLELEIYGPFPSMVYKVKKRYRKNIIIKGEKKIIEKFKLKIRKILKNFKNNNYILSIDVDPVTII